MSTLHTSPRPPGPGLGLGVERPADGRVLAAAALAAVLTDVAVRSGAAGLGGALLVVAVVAGIWPPGG